MKLPGLTPSPQKRRTPAPVAPKEAPQPAIDAGPNIAGGRHATSPLKVLLMSLYHPEIVRGGAQQVCYDLFCALKDIDGVSPTLLAAIDQTLTQYYKTGATITGFDGRENEFLFLSRDYDYKWHKLTDPRLFEDLAEFLRLVSPDVVHFHHFFLFGIDAISLVRRVLPNARIVFTFHEFMAICHADGHLRRILDGSNCTQPSIARCNQCFPDLPQSYFFLRERWIKTHLLHADLFTVPSQFMIDHFVRLGVDPQLISVTPNGLPRSSFAETPRATRGDGRVVFGFFGQLVDAKGVALLLDAVEDLRQRGLDFVVEINGDNLRFASDQLRRRVTALMDCSLETPSTGRVKIMGPYTRDHLSSRMARVDWCVIPSLWAEAHCLVLSEAWAQRVPAIAPDLGAFSERVKDGVDGLLFAAGDVRALADRMQTCITNSALCNSLAQGIVPPPQMDDIARSYRKDYAAQSHPADNVTRQLR